MDHLMPGMDGFQAIQAIKGNPDTATIPVVMYTSQEGELYVSQARALGAVGVLPKTVKQVGRFAGAVSVAAAAGATRRSRSRAGRIEIGGQCVQIESSGLRSVRRNRDGASAQRDCTAPQGTCRRNAPASSSRVWKRLHAASPTRQGPQRPPQPAPAPQPQPVAVEPEPPSIRPCAGRWQPRSPRWRCCPRSCWQFCTCARSKLPRQLMQSNARSGRGRGGTAVAARGPATGRARTATATR